MAALKPDFRFFDEIFLTLFKNNVVTYGIKSIIIDMISDDV